MKLYLRRALHIYTVKWGVKVDLFGVKKSLQNEESTYTAELKPNPLSQSGARGVMIIVTGYGHGDTSSIPGQDWLHFT